MTATFNRNGIEYSGDLDGEGNGTLFGRRDRESGDAHMPGTHRQVVTQVEVEKFRAVEFGDERYDLGEVTLLA